MGLSFSSCQDSASPIRIGSTKLLNAGDDFRVRCNLSNGDGTVESKLVGGGRLGGRPKNEKQIGDDLLLAMIDDLRQSPSGAGSIMVGEQGREQPLSKNIDGLGRLMAEIAKSNGGILANHGVGVVELRNQVCDQVGGSIFERGGRRIRSSHFPRRRNFWNSTFAVPSGGGE